MAVSVVQDAQLSRRVESRHIEHIPAGARHGQSWHQFAFWFGGNVNVFNVVMGAVTVSIGADLLVSTLIAIALLIALHATQGPRLDISWLVGWFAAAIAYLLLGAFTPGTARHDRQIATTALFARPRPGAMIRPATRSSA